MHEPRNYIVIVSPSLSGAEKRFFDIFCGLLENGRQTYLIVPSLLADILRAEYPDRNVFEYIIEVEMLHWSRIAFVYKFYKLLRSLDRGGRFHYPMNGLPYVHLLRGDHLTMSICDCEFPPSPWKLSKQGIYTYLMLLFADKIDVLSPYIFEWAVLQRPLKKKVSLTPGGTYIWEKRKIDARKNPTVAFIGRLEPGKGVLDFLDVFPAIWLIIKHIVPSSFKVCVAGGGSLSEEVNEKVAMMHDEGIPIYSNGYVEVNDFLEDVSVVLSMQRLTNFPSRVVAEALMSGASVIVRNTGDSDEFGHVVPGLMYCKAELEANELASMILLLLQRYKDDEQYGNAIRVKAEEVFCSKSYVEYFDSIIS